MLLRQVPNWMANWVIPCGWIIYVEGFFKPYMRLPGCTWDVLMFICGGHHYEVMDWPHEISAHQRRLGFLNVTFHHLILKGDAQFRHHFLVGIRDWQLCLACFVEDR